MNKGILLIGFLCIVFFSYSVSADYTSSTFGGSVTVFDLYPPTFSNPPAWTNTTGVSIDDVTWNITIEAMTGFFNWSIETSPDIGSNSDNGDANGSKEVELSGLSFGTNYTIYVNATSVDQQIGGDRGSADTNQTFWFETRGGGYTSSTFGGSVTVTQDYPSVVFVDDDADAGWYNISQVATINEAITNLSTSERGTIYIWDGSYSEEVVFHNHAHSLGIDIIGNGSSNVFCDGNGGDFVFDLLLEDHYNISGLNISDTDSNGAIRWSGTEFLNLSNCNITSDSYGITSSDSSYNTIKNCYFIGIDSSGIGIDLDDDSEFNTFYNNSFYGWSASIDDDGSLGNTWNTTRTAGTNIDGGPFLGGNYYEENGEAYDIDGFSEPYTIPGEGGSVDQLPLMNTEIYIEVNKTTWISGSHAVSTSIQENFTLWQNGTVNIDLSIGINVTNMTLNNYTDWTTSGADVICANFTTDEAQSLWDTETNMLDLTHPFTNVLYSDMSAFNPGYFEFGVRIWMPRSLTVAEKREDFKVVISASVHT